MPPSVDVWIAHEGLLDDPAVAARLVSLLAPDELERRNRMATESGRRQQLLARALQREVLSRYLPRYRAARLALRARRVRPAFTGAALRCRAG